MKGLIRYIKDVVAASLGERWVADSAGTATTLIDSVNLTQADDYWNNMVILMTSGNNAGLSRRITDFDQGTTKLTFDAFPNAIASGDEYQIIRVSPSTSTTAILTDLGDGTDASVREDLVGSVHAKLNAVLEDGWRITRKDEVLDLGAPAVHNLFDVTGEIECQLVGFIKVAVTSAGALTAQAGVTGNNNLLIANTAVAALLINRFWVDNAPTVGGIATPSKFLVSAANIVLEILAAAATAGQIEFFLIWRPLSTDAAVVASA